jgi:hypothetical protein
MNSWKDAWEIKDIEEYISYYDNEFRSGDMNLIQWKIHKQRLNKKYKNIKVSLIDMDIKRISSDRVDVSFIQDYRADKYRDHGFKKIELIQRGQDWKIKGEEWTPVQRRSQP